MCLLADPRGNGSPLGGKLDLNLVLPMTHTGDGEMEPMNPGLAQADEALQPHLRDILTRPPHPKTYCFEEGFSFGLRPLHFYNQSNLYKALPKKKKKKGHGLRYPNKFHLHISRTDSLGALGPERTMSG